MFEAVRDKKDSLSERIADMLLQLIIDNDLACGEKLPNEFELAEKLQVGRGTVREAVKLLVSRNVLEIQRGKGTYVAKKPGISADPLGFAFLKDKHKLASDLIEIRLILEPEIAALASLNANESEIQNMKEISSKIEWYAEKNIDYSDLDIELHTCIAQSTRNLVMPMLIPVINNGISLYNTLPRHSERMKAIYAHRDIIDAIAMHDPDKARDAMYKHLIYNRRSLEEIKSKLQYESQEL